MSRLRSASECSLESDLSDSDQSLYKAGQASDTESDIEMEVGGQEIRFFSVFFQSK